MPSSTSSSSLDDSFSRQGGYGYRRCLYDTPLSFRITFYIHLLHDLIYTYNLYIIRTLLVTLQTYNRWNVGWTLFFLFKLDMLKLILNVCCHLSQPTLFHRNGGQGLCRGGDHGRCLIGLGCGETIAEHGLVVGLDVGTLVSRPLSFWKRHPWNGRLIKWIPWNYYCWWILYYCQTSFKAVVCDGWYIFVLNLRVAKCMGRKEASETFESCWEKLCSYLLFSKSSRKEI